MGLGGGARLARGAPSSRAAKPAGSRRPAPTSSIVPTSTRTMCRMNVSASIQNSSRSPSRRHSARRTLPLEPHVLGLRGRERGEVVRSRAARAAHALERRLVERLMATTARGRAGTGSAPAAPAPDSNRSATARPAAHRSRRQPARPATTARSSRQHAVQRPQQAPRIGRLTRRHEADHLPPSMNAGIGAPGDGNDGAEPSTVERIAKHALDRPQPRLSSPPETPPVVLERELEAPLTHSSRCGERSPAAKTAGGGGVRE